MTYAQELKHKYSHLIGKHWITVSIIKELEESLKEGVDYVSRDVHESYIEIVTEELFYMGFLVGYEYGLFTVRV